MTDGPLIVQSDKTLLLEVDHPQARDCRIGDRAVRRAGALARARAHLPGDAAGAVERARRRATTPSRSSTRWSAYSRYPVPHALLVDVADTMDRYGRLQLVNAPGARPGADRARTGRCWRRCSARRRSPRCSARASTPTPCVVHPSERGRLKQALLKVGWPAEDLAGYVDGEAHPIELREEGWRLRDYQQEAVEGFWAGGSGVVVLPCGAGKTLVGAAAMAEAQGDHADPGHQHRRRAAVEARADRAHLAHRGGDRRVLRRAQGDPPGHDRHVPGDDHAPEGRVPPPGAVRLPRLGPDHLRRGAPAARADLPADGRPAVPPPARADRHARARGRPRGRRLLAHRARSATTPRGGTSRRRAGSRPPSAPRCGSRSPTPSGWRTRSAEPEERYRIAATAQHEDCR